MTGILVALAISAFLAQQNPSAPNPPTQQEPAPVRLFQGELAGIDASAKTIEVKGTNDSQMTFIYNDETQIVGLENGFQGLAGNIGSSLKVSYRNDRGTNVATKIEVQKH